MSNEKTNAAAMFDVRSVWLRQGLVLLGVAAGVIALYYPAFSSMVDIWMRSETFTHGFLILPISLWLTWEKRAELRRLKPQPGWWLLLFSVPIGIAWVLAQMVDVLVVQQYAAVSMLILAIAATLGYELSRRLMFPLLFLLFAVPSGEALVEPMVDFTADFTVFMLELTGIPVFREGNHFSIPSGDWSVVEACSGVRYLIASITLGVIYAYLTYVTWWKRALFILFSIVVPIIANGFRAYGIVMIGHLSDMKLAVGVDHLIYGWLWFGVVVTIMFLIGAIWREPQASGTETVVTSAGRARARSRFTLGILSVLLATAVWPGVVYLLDKTSPPMLAAGAIGVSAVEEWRELATAPFEWKPLLENPDAQYTGFFRKNGHTAMVYVGLYLRQRQGAELVNSQNTLVGGNEPTWRLSGRHNIDADIGGRRISLVQAVLQNQAGQRVLLWHWYRIGDTYTSNPYVAKGLEAYTRLFGERKDSAYMVLAVPFDESESVTITQLRDAAQTLLPGVEAAVGRALSKN